MKKGILLMAVAALLFFVGCDKVKQALDTTTYIILDESELVKAGVTPVDAEYNVNLLSTDAASEYDLKPVREGGELRVSVKNLNGSFDVTVIGYGRDKDEKEYDINATAEKVQIVAGVVNCRLMLTATLMEI